MLRVAGRQHTAHRVAAWAYRGGFELDDPAVRVEHACRGTPACFNPDHLRLVRVPAEAARRAA